MPRRRRIRIRWPIWIVLVAVVAGTFGWLYAERDRPPLDDLYHVRTLVNRAADDGPAGEGIERIVEAERRVEQAREKLRLENRRFVLLRNFGEVRADLAEARRLAHEGVEASRRARIEERAAAAERLVVLDAELRDARALLDRLNEKGEARRLLASADAHLGALRARVHEIPPAEAAQALDAAAGEIRAAGAVLRQRLNGFLARERIWQDWADETISWSRRSGGTAVLVDKLARRCYLLRAGKVADSFEVELGGNWMDRKLREGDRATPEGRYKVSKLKRNGESRYYRAALLDYPNDEDRSRFTRARSQGHLPRSARIGGLIEIHGSGGRGEDWTEGCVSLANDDIDQLFRHLQVGTPVTIVGLWREPPWLTGALAGDG